MKPNDWIPSTTPEEPMATIINYTPLGARTAAWRHTDGSRTLTVVAKAKLVIPEEDGAACLLAPEPVDLLLTPSYVGQREASSVHRPADVVPYKCGTDVVVIGHAHAPRGRAVPELTASVEIGELRKSIAVIGDRQWRASASGLVMTAPEPFDRMPLLYERAYGGCPPSQRARTRPDRDERNPVGTGYCVTDRDANGMRLPNLEAPQARIQTWRDVPPVAGLGPIDPAWAPRRRRAGRPNPVASREAPELDPRFYSIASPGLWSDEPLSGELHVELVHLTPQPILRFRLPEIVVRMDLHVGGCVHKRRAELWTIVLEPDEGRVAMVWGARCHIAKGHASERVELRFEPHP
jgi:hypothetical protein